MATSDRERYTRSILLTARTAPLVLTNIILREVKKRRRTLSEILLSSKDQLKSLTTSQYSRIFLSDKQVNTDLDTWDILLLYSVITCVFEDDLSSAEIDDVKLIRKSRSDLKLQSAYLSIKENDYKTYRDDFSAAVNRLASGLSREIQDKCKAFITSANLDSLEILSIVHDIKEFHTELPPLKEWSSPASGTGNVLDWLDHSLERQTLSSDVSSGIDEGGSLTSDDNDDEESLVEKIKELLYHVPLTISEEDIRARVKTFSHAEKNKSSHELMEMIIDIFQQKATSANISSSSSSSSSTTTTTTTDSIDISDARQEDTGRQQNQDYIESPETSDDEWESFLCSGSKKVAKRLLRLGKLPKQRTLDEICMLFKRKSKVILSICYAICKHIKSKHENIIDAWAAYTLQNTNRIIFVVTLKELEITEREELAIFRLDKIIDYSFIKRIVGEYSPESTEIINHNVTSGEHFDDDDYCRLQDCVAKYSVELMKEHKRLSVISACPTRSIGYGSSWNLKPENCIVFHVQTKHYIPIEEDPFKTHYDDIPIDVREGAFIPFRGTATDCLEHVQMGCQIRGEIEEGQYVEGTLGCFLDHPQYGVCGLTCAHVLLRPWDLIRLKSFHNGTLNWPLHDMCKTVYQPANQTNDIGHTVHLAYKEGSGNCSGMDVALFKLTSRHPKSSDFPDTSFAASTTATNIKYEHWRICTADRLNSKMKHVVKFGSTTELRDGIIEFDIVSVKELNSYPLAIGYSSIKLHKQIEVKPHTLGVAFADKGDSGALVFLVGVNSSEHTCIGIVEGGTSYGTVVVTPIAPILEELKVSSLKSFDSENTLSEIHGKIENIGSRVSTVYNEVQTVKNDVQTLTSHLHGMNRNIQNINSGLQGVQSIGSNVQSIQQTLTSLLSSPNTPSQNAAPPNT